MSGKRPNSIFPASYADRILYSNRKQSLLQPFHREMSAFAGLETDLFSDALQERVAEMARRAELEAAFWKDEIRKIEAYSREQAIRELIDSKKIRQKVSQIDAWTRRLREWTN